MTQKWVCAGATVFCFSLLATAAMADFLMVRRGSSYKYLRKSRVAFGSLGLLFGAQAGCIGLHVWDVGQSQAAAILSWAGCGLMVLAAAMNVAARFHLGPNWSNAIAVYTHQRLVTTGLYSWMRHPVFASLWLAAAGFGLAYGNLASLAIAVGLFAPLLAWRAHQEEIVLQTFFPEYRDYARQVPMYLPRLWRRS